MKSDLMDHWTEDLPWVGQYILDENNNAIPAEGLLSWGQWLEDHPEKRHLGDDTVGEARVSTIFLGLDYGAMFLRSKPIGVDPMTYKPRLWETMIFGGPCNEFQVRYTSHADALEGHRMIVQELCNKFGNTVDTELKTS